MTRARLVHLPPRWCSSTLPFAVLAAVALVASPCLGATAEVEPQIEPTLTIEWTRGAHPNTVSVRYELANTSSDAMSLCKRPGVSCSPAYWRSSSNDHHMSLSCISTPLPCPSDEIVKLAAGEQLEGELAFELPGDAMGEVSVVCEFRGFVPPEKAGVNSWDGSVGAGFSVVAEP